VVVEVVVLEEVNPAETTAKVKESEEIFISRKVKNEEIKK